MCWQDVEVNRWCTSTWLDHICPIYVIRLHQSNQAHSMACLAFIVWKYHVSYCIPCCNLQSMIMYVQYFFFIQRLVILKSKCKLMANSSFDINKTNNYTKNPTSYKRLCNNLHWVHLKLKVKKNEIVGIRKT